MTTLEDEIRDSFLRLFKPRRAFYIAALLLFFYLEGKEFVATFDLPFKEAVISLSGKLFILLTFLFASNAIFYLSQLPKLKETLDKAERMLDVQAFYPINYPDLPEGIKYSVRGYVSKSIKQINEHGTPLIVCSDREHFNYYKNFAFTAEKIYGTATRSPFYYASEPNIKSYIDFFKEKTVTRVTILDKNTIEHIIARNIYNIKNNKEGASKEGASKNGMPEIEWYETQFNANHTHLWFLQESKNDCLLTDIHNEQRYTNYAIYLFESNKILLNYFERTNNRGFFLLKCMPSSTPSSSGDNITSKINSFIKKLDSCTAEQPNGFYNNFQEMVTAHLDFIEDFKAKEIKFEYPIGVLVNVEITNLLDSKGIKANDWDQLFNNLNSRGDYDPDFIKQFPSLVS